MMNNYAETGGGFNSNHGQTSRPTDTQKQQNLGSTWGYNSQMEGMYYGGEHQPVFVAPYEGSTKHSNYSQYPSGTIHQPVPTPVVKCHEACCQHFQDRYPLNPAPLRYQPSGPVQPRYADVSTGDSRQYFSDRRSMQPSLSRKKVYTTENGYPGIPERHFSQYMGRGQLHMADTRQQMQMMRSQYPMYPHYWGGPRGWSGPRMNCPPPPSYHQSINQGTQLQAGLKMTDGTHYIDSSSQKPINAQHRRGVTSGSGGTEIVRPVPEPKRSALDPNLQSCYEFGYPTGFVPFSEVNKIQGGSITSQSNNSTCKIPSDKQFHPHQMQYTMQGNDRNLMNCNNPINDLSYPMNFPLSGNDSYIRPGLEDGQQISDARKLSLQYDSSLGKKRPDLDLRQYLATWEDDEDESTRISEPLALGNSGAPYIVVDCRSLEGEAAAKLQERFKTSSSQGCSSKPRSSSPNTERKCTEEQARQNEDSERTGLHSEFQTQTSYAPSMPGLMSDSDKSMNFWNGANREGEGIIGKGGAFQPLDCSKRDSNLDSNAISKRDSHPHSDLSVHKLAVSNESTNMSFDALVSYYGDNRRMVDGGYDFVEMTERLVNNSDKTLTNNRTSLDHQLPAEISRPCDPRLQQSQLGNNPSIYNKVTPRYPTNNYQHFKPGMSADPYYSYKHPMATSKYFGYDNSQIDPNYDYHKIASEFDSARMYGNKEGPKDPRRLFHQDVDKTVESAFLDPMRKTQIPDCFQDKTNLEFTAVDPEQFITPIIIKKSDLDHRDKGYSEKNSAIKERMDAINNENQTHSEKTVLITSQNGPPEIFRVPYSPEKELSHKDNVVTLHSGDQTKSNTITVEVPYVQQYSTLVKLSEEISRTETSDEKSRNKAAESVSTSKTSDEEFKKPTSFKLKRLPNSKEWTVEGKKFSESNCRVVAENDTTSAENSSCEINEERDALKSSVTVSNLNMPSLDDIRDGDENCEAVDEEHSKRKLSDGALCSSKTSNTCDEVNNKNKYNIQPPQMAIVQPMNLNQSETEPLESSSVSKLCEEDGQDKQVQKLLSPASPQTPNQTSFESEKMVTESDSQMELISGSEISKHENFRTHKKIQSSFSSALPNCLSSPNEDFMHTQDISSGGPKEPYSPFHVYSDCDMNSQITDYFKIDGRSTTGDKILDTRIPSSPGVEGMFEDINHSNQNQLYQSKTCNFQDLTDPNMSSLDNHNAHFQSFSSIFSDDADKRGRPDGSILQMNDKKYLKHIFDDIENHQMSKSLERVSRMESNSMSEMLHCGSDKAEKSPPIPPISLKLNETKKIWCIAKKDQHSDQSNSPKNMSVMDSVLKSTNPNQETLTIDAVNELGKSLTEAMHEETSQSCTENYHTTESSSELINTVLEPNSNNNSRHLMGCMSSENEHKNLGETQGESVLNQFIFNEVNKENTNPSMFNILSTGVSVNEKSSPSVGKNPDIKTDLKGDEQGESFLVLKSENKCLSVLKYYPRIDILERIRSADGIRNLTLEALVFDENGKHFPKQSDTEKTQTSDSKDIAQEILDNLITKSVTYNNITENNSIIHTVLSSGNFQNQYNGHEETNSNSDDSNNVLINIQSVIKFDSSSSQHIRETREQEYCITKTTEMFIQHEKEICQHYSVIKSVQSEDYTCSINKKKKTTRSIFSPRSDDCNEEDNPHFTGSKDMQITLADEDSTSNLYSNKSPANLDQMDCLDFEEIDNSHETQVLENSSSKLITSSKENDYLDVSVVDSNKDGNYTMVTERNKAAQELIAKSTVSNIIDDEEFRGFGSPKTTSPVQHESDSNIKGIFEIDDALELMGLSTEKLPETSKENVGNEEDPLDISVTEQIAEKDSVSLKQSLENEAKYEEYLFQKNDNSPFICTPDDVSFQTDRKICSTSQFNEPDETIENEKHECLEHNNCSESRKSDSTSKSADFAAFVTLSTSCNNIQNESPKLFEVKINKYQHNSSDLRDQQLDEKCQTSASNINSLEDEDLSVFSHSSLSSESGSSDDSRRERNSEIKNAFKNIYKYKSHQVVFSSPTFAKGTDSEGNLLKSCVTSKGNSVKTCVTTEASNSKQVKATSTNTVDRSPLIISSTSSQGSDNSKVKVQVEDFEARLETSVIVRNNLCSGVICNQLNESSTLICENSVLVTTLKEHFVPETDESIYGSRNIINKNLINVCSKNYAEDDLSEMKSQESTEEIPINSVDSCSKSSFGEEYKPGSDGNDHDLYQFKMDYDLDSLTTTSVGSSDEINEVSRNDFESGNYDFSVVKYTETQMSNTNQASVVTSKDLGSTDIRVTPEVIEKVDESEKLCYCVGESVFLHHEEEPKVCLENCKLSYFHEFKKRKWEKFSKSFNERHVFFSENVDAWGKSNKRDYTIINFSMRNDCDIEKFSTKDIDAGCSSVYKNCHRTNVTDAVKKKTIKAPSPVTVEFGLDVEDDDYFQNSDCITTDKFYSTKYSKEITEPCTVSEHENISCIIEEGLSDCITILKDSSSTNLVKGLPVPLQDKFQFLSTKGKNNFCIKRDSLKISEPEAVLKEMFSSDPETDDSESKENECPDTFPQDTKDNSPQQLEAVSLVLHTNAALTSLNNLAGEQSKWSDFNSSQDSDVDNSLFKMADQSTETVTTDLHDSLFETTNQDNATVSVCHHSDVNDSLLKAAVQDIAIESLGQDDTLLKTTHQGNTAVSLNQDYDLNNTLSKHTDRDNGAVNLSQDSDVIDNLFKTANQDNAAVSLCHSSDVNDTLLKAADQDIGTESSCQDSDVNDTLLKTIHQDNTAVSLSQDYDVNNTLLKDTEKDNVGVNLCQDSDVTDNLLKTTNQGNASVSSHEDSGVNDTLLKTTDQDNATVSLNQDSDVNDTLLKTTDQDNATVSLCEDSDVNDTLFKAADQDITIDSSCHDSDVNDTLLQITHQSNAAESLCHDSNVNNTLLKDTDKDNAAVNLCQDSDAIDTLLKTTNQGNASVSSCVYSDVNDTLLKTTDQGNDTVSLYQDSDVNDTLLETADQDNATVSLCRDSYVNDTLLKTTDQDNATLRSSQGSDVNETLLQTTDQDNIIVRSCQGSDVNGTLLTSTDQVKATVAPYQDSDINDTSLKTIMASCHDSGVNGILLKTTDQVKATVASYQDSDTNDTALKTIMASSHDSGVNDNLLKTTDQDKATVSCQDSGVNGTLLKTTDQDKATSCQDSYACLIITDNDKATAAFPGDSDVNDSVIKTVYQDKTTDPMSVVTVKDSLSTTGIFQDSGDQATNSKLHSGDSIKSCAEEGEENILDSKNVKVNCVQDSLRNSQHLNKETFPLQCLVEAALALENVDSKQMLLNNSRFSGLYSQSNESFAKSLENDELLNDSLECSVKNTSKNDKHVTEEKSGKRSILTPADREIFSKFEEANYNLRASTRIVTSSSSNIIPYAKRKYGLKSSKISSKPLENKQKKTETLVTEKTRTKKRRGCFTYPRSKRRKKVTKDKQKCQSSQHVYSNCAEIMDKNPMNDIDFESLKSNVEKEIVLDKQDADKQFAESEGIKKTSHVEPFSNLNSVLQSAESEEDSTSKSDVDGNLTASENTSAQGNIFCVHVNSDKMDEYVNKINLGELEVLSDTTQAVFKDCIDDNSSSDVPNVTLENGTSLVIIIEELDGDADKKHYDERNKGESDVILGSLEQDCSVTCLPRKHSILGDCSDSLTTEYLINESCICPPELEINDSCENGLLKENSNEMLENEHYISKSAYEINDNIEDRYGKYSVNCNQELLTVNCYEEINANLINDIGNWPFVEEEVAEFDSKSDLPNNIPEEGRKIELKCSLPWKKIFNMSKTKRRKSKTSRKVSGLELGPAKVEVRLRAPSSEWKVISDYHENSSPVVKVSRLILQRDSDVSSHSEKDSEEENENKRNSSQSSVDSETVDKTSCNNDHVFGKSVSNDENWQPVVLLTRNKELDELTLSFDTKLHHQRTLSSCSSQISCNDEEKHEDNCPNLFTESETSEIINENDQLDLLHFSHSCESSPSSQNSENKTITNSKSVTNSPEHFIQYDCCQGGKMNKVHVYETYSPSGCNSALTNENTYSPSNPHYSPGICYADSDSSTSFVGVRGKNIPSYCDDDVFLDNDDLTQTTCLQTIESHKEDGAGEECNLKTNDLCQLVEQRKTADDHATSGNNMNCSQSINVSDANSSAETQTNNSFDLASECVVVNKTNSTPNLEAQDNINNSGEASKESSCQEDLLNVQNGAHNETKETDLLRDIIFDQKKKSKRKMPKNFFVRKKLRKIKGDFDSTDEKSLFGDESNLQKSGVTVSSEFQALGEERFLPNRVTMSSNLAVGKRQETAMRFPPLESVQSDLQSGNSGSVNDEHVNNESDSSLVCDNSRLKCVQKDLEDSSPVRLSEFPLAERTALKQRLRNGGRGLKRPCEGHSKEDTKRRRKKLRSYSNRCQECDIQFKNKEELSRHNAYRHVRRRELHHCLLCQRSFSSAVRHSLHVQGRSHRHMALTQRHTMHAMHRLLVGGEFPHIPPLSRSELRALAWRPAHPGYTHFYHELTPLQAALQEHNSDVSEGTLSEGRTPND